MSAPDQGFTHTCPVEDRPIYEIGKEAGFKHARDEEIDLTEAQEHNAKTVSERIDAILERNKHRIDPYYIWMASVWEGVSGVTYQQLGIRTTRPDPVPGITLWKFTPQTGVLSLEWTLPQERNWATIEAESDLYPKSVIKWINDYKAGVLK